MRAAVLERYEELPRIPVIVNHASGAPGRSRDAAGPRPP